MEPVKVSVVIATINRQLIVRDTVRMLATQDYENSEFVVIDQTAERDSELESLICELGPKFKYIRLAEPNLPAARNLGIRSTSGEIILFIDDDVEPDADLVSLHVRAHQEGLNVGAVSGLFLNADRPLEQSLEWCRKAFDVPDVSSGGVFDVSWAIGGNMSYRRSAIMDAGMFDENFRGCAIGEDNDASERVRLKGYRIVLDCRIQLRHLNLSRGGCEVRNPAEERRVHAEHFELGLYRFMKKFKMDPCWESALTMLALLRRYTMSRSLIRQGVRAIIERETECVAIIGRVLKSLRHSPWSNPSNRTVN